ncbi:MAG: winged helix-turn-helix domain-containing protein, partial [Sedimenticola sp.]|nr:winged helix-turn-helix domain-containing protein [Sedimenticola sp.]
NQVVEETHSQHAIRAVDFLFQQPVFAAPVFTEHSEIPKPTAARILSALREAGLLHTIREGRGRRYGIYAFRDLLNIAEGRKIL